MSSQKIKLEGDLLERAKQCAEASGYASVDEFVLHTIEKEVKRLHSYEVPEFIALPVNAGSREYLGWLVQMCKPEE